MARGLGGVRDACGREPRVSRQPHGRHGKAGRPAGREAHDRAAVAVEAPARVVLQQIGQLALLQLYPRVQAGLVRLPEGREQHEGGLFRSAERRLDGLLSVDADVPGHELQLLGPFRGLLGQGAQLFRLLRAALVQIHLRAHLRPQGRKVVCEFRVRVAEVQAHGQAETAEAVRQPPGRIEPQADEYQREKRPETAAPSPAPAPAPPPHGLFHVFDFPEIRHADSLFPY